MTKFQRQKLRLQALCTIAISRDLHSKYTNKSVAIQSLLTRIHDIRESKSTKSERGVIIHLEIEKHDKHMMSWRVDNCLPIIVGNVTALQCNNKHTASTVLDWYIEFMSNDTTGWLLDSHGKHERYQILHQLQYGLELKLEMFMKVEKCFTVEVCMKWLNEQFQRLSATYPELLGITVKKTQVHKWIRSVGATFDDTATKKCYYTDRHEDADNVSNRVFRYIPELYRQSLREAVWATWPLKNASPEAIADAKMRSGCEELRIFKVNEEDCIKIHVDFLQDDQHAEFRKTLLSNTGYPGEFYYDTLLVANACGDGLHIEFVNMPAGACQYGHTVICKCHLPIKGSGRDEKIFHDNAIPKRGWRYKSFFILLSKGAGVGLMVSGIVCSYRPYGFPMTADELDRVNIARAVLEKSPLQCSPGSRLFKYGNGKNREGYWTNEHIMEQKDDHIDCVEVLYPNHQIAIEVDWSNGHMKYNNDALRVADMNVGWGGKQPIMHASKLSEGDLGELINPTYHRGDVQDMVFVDACNGPYYDKDASPFDTPYTEEELENFQ